MSYCIPVISGTVWETRDTIVNKTNKTSAFKDLIFSVRYVQSFKGIKKSMEGHKSK